MLTTAGAITDTQAVLITGTTSLTAGAGNDITLDNANNFGGEVRVVSGNNVTLNDIGAFTFGNGGTSTISGNLAVTANGAIDQTGVVNVTGTTTLTAGALHNITLSLGNTLGGSVTIVSASNLNLRNISSAALFPLLSASINNLTLTYNAAPIVIPAGLPNVGGNLNLTGLGITQSGAFTTPGTLTLNGLGGAIVLNNSGNNYTGLVTITGGASADMFFALANEGDVGPVSVTGAFTLQTSAGVPINLAGTLPTGGFDIPDSKLADFDVGTLAVVSTGVVGNGINISSPFNSLGIQGLALITQGAGNNIDASGVITTGSLSLSSSGSATFTAVNQVSSLGLVDAGAGGFTFRNGQGLSITAPITVTGNVDMRVAGQFYNQSGSAQPFGGTSGSVTVRSLSLAGGLPNLISGLVQTRTLPT